MPRKKKEVQDEAADNAILGQEVAPDGQRPVRRARSLRDSGALGEPGSDGDAGANGPETHQEPQHVETPGLDLPLDDRRPARRARAAPARFLAVPRPASFKEFLEGAEFSSIPDYDRLVLMLLWLLVRKHGGRVPNKPDWIAWRIGLAVGTQEMEYVLKRLKKIALITAVGGDLVVNPVPKRKYTRKAPRGGPSTPARYDPTDLTPSEAEPELSPAELLRRHRETWGQV